MYLVSDTQLICILWLSNFYLISRILNTPYNTYHASSIRPSPIRDSPGLIYMPPTPPTWPRPHLAPPPAHPCATQEEDVPLLTGCQQRASHIMYFETACTHRVPAGKVSYPHPTHIFVGNLPLMYLRVSLLAHAHTHQLQNLRVPTPVGTIAIPKCSWLKTRGLKSDV